MFAVSLGTGGGVTYAKMKNRNISLAIEPFIIGIVLGFIAKWADGRKIRYYFPILSDIMGRFGRSGQQH